MRGQPRMVVLDLQAFAASALANSEGLTAALTMLESCLAEPDIPLDLIVQDLCSVPHLFEFILSALPNAEGLVHRILDTYLGDPALVEASLASTLLRRVSSVIFALPPGLFPSDTIRRIERHKVYVTVDASQMACEITGDLRMILKFYLELLLEPFLAQQLKDAYVSAGDSMAIHPSTETKVIETVEPEPPAYSKVQSKRAALYMENANGFGDWRIIIGSNARNRLRELAKRDRKKCALVVKKIRQLSKGHFSDENQKRLNGSDGIPIFEAKIQRDLRLVYQIDVVLDRDGEVEQQAIKIYGVYSNLSHIWGAIGRHLAGKSEAYCQRCTFRNPPVHAGGDIYPPASFPPECLQEGTKPTPPALSDEDMEELHSLLVLEKYVTFSQAFLRSLIANKDVQHMIELTPQERKIVECTTSCYVLGRSGTGKTTTMLFKMLGIQRAWQMQTSGMPTGKPRQIFVTKSCFLVKNVKEYFTKLLESLPFTESGSVGDGNKGRVDIPRKYSALEENHFPLFVTFDELARMIAADVLSSADPQVQRIVKFFINADEIKGQDSFVTYDVFARTYWPRFPWTLTKGLEPWLVFSEIMGIIKGSEKSLSCPDGFLDEEMYCGLSARSNPTFASQRRTLYAIFKLYCKLKKGRRHHDVADRTHAILRTLMKGTPLQGQKVDYLYVDEAQDNLLIDALLLRLICRNPEGLFWAGDTAQAISAGSSFRFNDLKAFLYRIERDQSTHLIQDRSITDPEAFQLVTNYRSHGGIVNCAHTVIERIMHFWPDAIDVLQREHGVVEGSPPVFFRGWDQGTAQYERFIFGEPGRRIKFGANQYILVRNDEAAQKLTKEVGEIGTIMTIYDCKGLESDDVILYNFFEDSAVDVSRWRVLLNDAEGDVGGQDLAQVRAPSFGRDEGRFAGVCSELKSLYVGVTRAKKNLWIFDKSIKSESMWMIWTSRNQVQNCAPGDVPHIAVSSTPEEWESSGQYLFNHMKYSQAMQCFIKASRPRMVAVCKAFHLQEVARATVGVASPKVQQDAFLAAADAFTASGRDAPLGKDQFQYYRNAADCYVRAKDNRKAAIRYISAQEYDLAARHFRKAGLFDETLKVLHEYSRKIPSEALEELYTVCRLFYCSKHNSDRPRLPLFSSFEEELEFYEDYGLDFARATLLESRGRYLEAAKLHLSENQPIAAIRALLKEKGSRDAIQQATHILLNDLWRRCSFAIPSKEIAADREVGELLKLASQLPLDFLDPLDHDEISMFRAIAQMDQASLEKLSHVFIKAKRNAAALLALDHFFWQLPVLESYELQEMSRFLDQFRQYSRLLYEVISHPNPLGANTIKRLFCIRDISNTGYHLEPRSCLHGSATGNHHGPILPRPSVVTHSQKQVVTALRKYLTKRLHERVTEENKLCYNAVVFSQCLTFIVIGQCDRKNCPQEHVKSVDLDSKRYNMQIGIHLQQLRILQLMYFASPRLDRSYCVLGWLSYLYEAFHPPSHIQGSTADLDLSTIPDAHESMDVMKYWVRDALDVLFADCDRSAFLTNVLKLTSLLFIFDESNALQCITRHATVQAFAYPDGRYFLQDIVSLFGGTRKTCIPAGLFLLRHVLKSKQIIDLSVFCDYFEMVVAKTSVSLRLLFDPPLDGLVLPRGWLSSRIDFSTKREVKIAPIVDVLSHVRDLLMCLQSDTASRTFTLSHTKLTPMLCNVFTSRICKALCLLVYNAGNDDLGHKVKDIFDALRTAEPTQSAHPLYRKYVEACRDEYLKVMVEYDADANVVIDDLVQLLHTRRDPLRCPALALPRIKHIQFADPSEIPSLLASRFVVARSDLRADAPVLVPRSNHVSQVERDKDEGETRPEGPEVELVDNVHDKPHELAPMPNEPALICDHEPTEVEICAANRIQAAYRTYRNHREAQVRATGRELNAQRNTIFIACLKRVYASHWGRTPYRTLYLWALPRLLVCLDKAIATTREFKRKTGRLLVKESHERLEELGQQMSRVSSLLKEGHNLRKKIEPNATMHQEKDKAAMKQAVLNVQDFVRRLPVPAPEIQKDLDLAYELVMVEKQQVPEPEKPTLNTEDL